MMGSKYPDIFASLVAAFEPHEVKQRPGNRGQQLHYVTATTVANRLDNVLGPEGWDFEIAPWGNEALIGVLIIRLPDGTVIRKSNVGGKADMQAADDGIKSAASDCLKRCAALLGVGRYLYRDGVPHFFDGEVPSEQQHPATNQEGKWGYPRTDRAPAEPGHPSQDGNGGGQPRTGKSLYAWAASEDKKDESLHLVKALNAWGKSEGLPFKMIDWQPADVTRAFEAAQAHFRAFYGGGSGDE